MKSFKEYLNEYTYGNNSAMAGQDPDFDKMLLRRDARKAGMSVDDYIQYLNKKKQDQEYELEIGPEKRAELKAKADELAEIRRQQLRKEALEDAELAFQRAETIAQRQAEMEKIKRKFEHELAVINTEHKNNMEAIKTGNKHDLDKMDKEHRQEKDMFDKEAGERDKDRAERERERQQNKPQQPANDFKMPEPEMPEEEPADKEYQNFKADIFKLSGLPLPAPQKPMVKPSKFDTTSATDIDFKDVSDKKDDKVGNKPAALPAPKKEDMSRLRDLVAEMDAPVSSDTEMSEDEWKSKFKGDPAIKIINPLRMMPKDGSYFRLAMRDGQAVGASRGSGLGRSALGPETHVEFSAPKSVEQALKDLNLERFMGSTAGVQSAPTRTPRPQQPAQSPSAGRVLRQPMALRK